MKIAIIGATGLVGQKTIEQINNTSLKNQKFLLYAYQHCTKPIKIGENIYKIKKLTKNIIKQKPDFALFCTSEEVSLAYIPELSKLGTKCIDFSAAYRHTQPLIVPEINLSQAKGNIICNPNCSTAGAVMALYKINENFGLKSITYSSYQAASGAGRLGLLDLKQKDSSKLKKFDIILFDNLIPYIGEIDKNGNSTEENKMINETKNILNLKRTKISATCVRVPISVGHSISITFTTKKRTTTQKITSAIKTAKNVTLIDKSFPTPMLVRNQKDVLVGRIRKTENRNEFAMFVCVDNLLKGASQNAVQILEGLVERESM